MKNITLSCLSLVLAITFLLERETFTQTPKSLSFKAVKGAKSSRNLNPQKNMWQDVNESNLLLFEQGLSKPKKYRSLKLNSSALKFALAEAPPEFAEASKSETSVILYLPLPDGDFGRFQIKESSIMSDELAAQFPDIKNYIGQGIDDPNATTRLSWTMKGLNAFVISNSGSFMITPYSDNNQEYYLSYYARDAENEGFECLTRNAENVEPNNYLNNFQPEFTGNTLRRYRLILSATAQFYAFSGSTDAGTVATINTLINNVNAIYERELTIRFIFQGWAADKLGIVFPPNQDFAQLAEINQQVVDNLFGTTSYDVGHVLGFDLSPGGFGTFSAVCNTQKKAKGATVVSPNLYHSTIVLSHELGHQFNARHTFTPIIGACLQASDPEGRAEPGSGSTIMSYAGICSPEDLQPTGDDYFHLTSLLKIIQHVDNVFPACGQRTSTGNSPPVINGASGVGSFIPANTPFSLTAFATDSNNDPITYNWEQIDSGVGTPILRSYRPMNSSSRTFPSLPFILNSANTPPLFINGFLTGEILPNSTRTLNFAVTARDNRSTGGTSAGTLQVFVRGDAGPFTVTQPNTNIVWAGGSQQTLRWNVANTNLSPINTANVRILLSSDGGQTFPTVLSNTTPNDGIEAVTLPNIQTSTARVKIEAIGNIYFDISNTNFTISQTSNVQITVQTNPSGLSFTVDGTNYTSPQTFSWQSGSNHTISTTSPQGNSSTRYLWSNWSDGGAISHITAPTSNTTYTANFTTQHFLSMNSGTGGTASPASGFYNAGQQVQISAIPNSGFNFSNWTGTGSGSYIGTNNPATITMNAPVSQTANFSATPACSYLITPDNRNFGPSGGSGSVGVTTNAGCGWTATSNVPWINITGGGSGNGTATFNIAVNLTPTRRTGTAAIAGRTFTVIQIPHRAFDFDGDSKADIAVFRPSLGAWFISNSSNGLMTPFPFGLGDDLIAPADYDGDGKTDIAVFRPSAGAWYLQRSREGFTGVSFGASGDIPVAGDYDKDGKADIAVFRPSTGAWYWLNSSNGQFKGAQWGIQNDKPQVGDFDGDGQTDLAVFRPTDRAWYILLSLNNTFFGINFGLSDDLPTPADFDGDGKTDIAVYRPSAGSWYRINSSTNQFSGEQFGVAEDKPVAADYDGDGKADVAVFRPSASSWYVQGSTAGFSGQRFGAGGDVPIPFAFGR